MKKISTIILSLFIINGLLLSYFTIIGDKQRVFWFGLTFTIACLGLQYLHLKEEKDNSLKYIRR